jgi:D-alanyl-D-alanine-carboxypeptidase/D-alanyl-D-alanine-endopeptidase
MLRSFIVICGLTVALTAPVTAEDRMLTEAVELTGTILFVGHDVPGLVIGVVRNGETAVAGFGKTRADGGEPGGDTMMRIGSITKVFTGLTLAHLVADGTVHLTDPVARHLDWDVAIPEKDGNAIRLIDLGSVGISTVSGGMEPKLARSAKQPISSGITSIPSMAWMNQAIWTPWVSAGS